MYTIICEEIPRKYHNHGMHCEQMLTYTLTHEMRDHGILPFDMGSDIPDFDMSVKSSRASVASGSLMKAQTKEGQIEEFLARCPSTLYAYVSFENVAYIMNKAEFRVFLELFGFMDVESSRNGNYKKLRIRQESIKMMNWFHACVA